MEQKVNSRLPSEELPRFRRAVLVAAVVLVPFRLLGGRPAAVRGGLRHDPHPLLLGL